MGWFDDLFGGGKNPADAANPYLNQISGKTAPYLKPYSDAGQGALKPLEDNYSKLLENPGDFLNKMGASYQKSPGFDAAMKNALMASNHAAAAGGMAGSPANQYDAMKSATDLSNQDYDTWLNHTLGLYGEGLSGEQDMSHMGLTAGTSLADLIAQQLAQQGAYAYQGQAGKNAGMSSLFGNLGKGVLGAFGGMGGGIPGMAKGAMSAFV